MQKKKFSFIHILIVLIFFILFIELPIAASRYDPRLNWQVLESPHFSVYFHLNEVKTSDYNSNNNSNIINNNSNSNNMKEIAQQIADIAEETYCRVNAQLGSPNNKHHHLQKIAIIIEDFSDYALGFATPFPHRTIRLSLTAPTAKSFDMKFISWLKMVITHEYTHIAHFEMTAGPTTALRALFGQILVPNALQPMWSIEGLAVYNETKFTTGGRGIDTRYDMYLRMAALEDQFNTLDQISGYYLTTWPDGTAPYIYGQSIIHFIAQKYGEDKVISISEIFCEYPYLGFNYALKGAIGLNVDELYQNWKDNLKERYQLQAQNILSQKNFAPSQQLTKYHYWVDYPHWLSTPEGDKIAVRVSTPHSYPFIQIIDPLLDSPLPLTPRSTENRTKSQLLIKRTYGRDSSFSISPDDSKIIYAKLVDYEQFYKFYDLYLFDLKTKKETRLSEGLRARDPSWSPDPDPDNPQIVSVVNQSGTNNLALINLPSPSPTLNSSINENRQPANELIAKRDIIYLTDFRDGTQLYQPSWSPDGNMIALSAWHQGYQDIYILNFDSDNLSTNNLNPDNIGNSTLQPIFCDKSIDLSPCWSPDGKYLFFASDRTGIYNIFAFSLSDKKLYQITNVLGGAFQPAVSPDGTRLAFIEYHATGYELHLMEMTPDLNPNQWTEIEIKQHVEPQITIMAVAKQQFSKDLIDPNTPFKSNSNSKNNYPIHPYHPLTSFWPPTYWIPAARLTENDLNGLEVGFSTELKDVLGFHSLPLSVTYGILNNNLSYNFNYYNYSRLPILNLYLSGNTVLDSQTQTPTSWWEKGKTGINIYFPLEGQTAFTTNSRPYRQIFSLGYQYEKSSSTDTTDTDTPSPLNNTDPQKITSLRLGCSYSDAEKYGFSISPELGNSFSLTYEHADKALGGDYTFDKLIFDGRKFIPLLFPSLHQVLALRLAAGTSSSSILESGLNGEKFKLGGSYSAENLSNADTNTFSLRGYKPATLEGNNFLLTSLEYRFPLANIEHSLKLGPLSIFLERLSGALFIDMGNAWESSGPSVNIDIANKENEINSIWQDFKSSIGAELKADFNYKYDSPFTLRLGAAKALTAPHGYDIYITLDSSF